ncbi:MAG: hypothetical protein QX196_14650 [Methylococcaceae bacterium]
MRLTKITGSGLLESTVTIAIDSQGYFPIFRKLALQNYRVLNFYRLNGVKRMLSNVIKLSRWLSGVEAILPASAPLSQRFILRRGT